MNLSYLVVHHEISDEAAAQLSELLNDLAFAFECQHLAQVRRYYEELRDIERSCHNGQLDLFADVTNNNGRGEARESASTDW